MLRPLFPTWYTCAKKLGDVELTVRLLVEMIGYGAFGWLIPSSLDVDLASRVIGDIDEPGTLQEDLLTLLKV